MNDYQVLGLKDGATASEVRRAYRKLAMKHHPDRGGDAEQFKRLSAAYRRLVGKWQLGSKPGPTEQAARDRRAAEEAMRSAQQDDFLRRAENIRQTWEEEIMRSFYEAAERSQRERDAQRVWRSREERTGYLRRALMKLRDKPLSVELEVLSAVLDDVALRKLLSIIDSYEAMAGFARDQRYYYGT